jgi:solute carrier family 6 GABA transporter-like protein 1
MALELSLGKLYRSGDIVCFSRISSKLRGLGLASIFGAFAATTYYNVLMAWILVYFFRSFQTTLPWNTMDPMAYFNNEILMIPEDGRQENPEVIVGHTFGCLLVIWIIVYFCLFKGVQLTGKITYVTMTLPVILIIVLFVRSVTLPGARQGIIEYIGRFDSSKLSNPLIWSEAVGQVTNAKYISPAGPEYLHYSTPRTSSLLQIFFSIGVAFGVFTAYASYNSVHQNTAVDSVIISLSNSIYEIFCGFVVFAVVGYLRTEQPDGEIAVGSFGLAFVTYPVAFSTLPGNQFWSVFFFLTLFILGIDSAFSLVEAGVTCLMDSRLFAHYRREWVVAIVCSTGFLIGVLFCTEVGVYALDATDYFLNNIAIVFVGIMECVGPSFMYKFWTVADTVGLQAKLVFDICFLVSMISGISLGYTGHIILGSCFFVGLNIVGLILAIAISKSHLTTVQTSWWILLGNIEMLREDINSSLTKGKLRLPLVWSLTLKFICIPVLFFVVSIPLEGMAVGRAGVPIPFRWLGLIFAFLTLAVVGLGVFVPRWFVWCLPPGEEENDEKRFRSTSDVEMDSAQVDNREVA